MTRANGGCESVNAAAGVDRICASIRSREPTTEAFEPGMYRGHTVVRGPAAEHSPFILRP